MHARCRRVFAVEHVHTHGSNTAGVHVRVQGQLHHHACTRRGHLERWPGFRHSISGHDWHIHVSAACSGSRCAVHAEQSGAYQASCIPCYHLTVTRTVVHYLGSWSLKGRCIQQSPNCMCECRQTMYFLLYSSSVCQMMYAYRRSTLWCHQKVLCMLHLVYSKATRLAVMQQERVALCS